MKKRFLILSSLITLLLTFFSLPIYADEDPTDPSSVIPVPNSIRLDSYFYENYDLLPYIESIPSSAGQYINTGINGSNNIKLNLKASNFSGTSNRYVFGAHNSGTNRFGLAYSLQDENNRFWFYENNYVYHSVLYPYQIFDFELDKNVARINGNVINEFIDSTFDTGYPITLFAENNANNVTNFGYFRLYSCSIYDYGSGSYVRYFYPAKSKSGGVIGLYDAVSDTFFTTPNSVPFSSPVNDSVLNFQIGTFLTSSIGWITDILEFAITTPIILIFMAIGLAGAMFRWGRRLVHF